ncbi:hypothetical protein [Burkholderia cepacia]|uniref:hypothetical protein n=1 Tax=Burkholderia cepacia TaxID=292 RepID=UPI000A526498|nr:hypothetical protein [Burkholderia cepacia]NLA18390.1 hypothetical protein [Burkholderia cepacia]NTX22463.1 hypothetical protein [Burkholderia cepacia]
MLPNVSERAIRVRCVANANGLSVMCPALRSGVAQGVVEAGRPVGMVPESRGNTRQPVFTRIESQTRRNGAAGMQDGKARCEALERAVLISRWQASACRAPGAGMNRRETAIAAGDSVSLGRTTRRRQIACRRLVHDGTSRHPR